MALTYQLLENENIILTADWVNDSDIPSLLEGRNELILTNRRIIHLIKYIGGLRKVNYYSLDAILLSDGEAQAITIKTKYNFLALQIFFENNKQRIFYFYRDGDETIARKWADTIKILLRSRITTKCIFCRAPITGYEGHTSRCSYCNSEQKIYK